MLIVVFVTAISLCGWQASEIPLPSSSHVKLLPDSHVAQKFRDWKHDLHSGGNEDSWCGTALALALALTLTLALTLALPLPLPLALPLPLTPPLAPTLTRCAARGCSSSSEAAPCLAVAASAAGLHTVLLYDSDAFHELSAINRLSLVRIQNRKQLLALP